MADPAKNAPPAQPTKADPKAGKKKAIGEAIDNLLELLEDHEEHTVWAQLTKALGFGKERLAAK